jgi:hypothetical protein
MSTGWIRIGKHLVNPSAIAEIIDQGEQKTRDGMKRVVLVKLVTNQPLMVSGDAADAIWREFGKDPLFEAEEEEDRFPDNPFGFHV